MRLVALAAAVAAAAAINNGLGLVPEMGANTWYMLHRFLTYPNYTWVPGYVLADDVLNIGNFMAEQGYLAAGYSYMNLDDAIVWTRNATGYLVADAQAFPYGFKNYTAQVSALGFKPGVYTDRGNWTCCCYAGGHKRPGSFGYEKQDAEFWAAEGFVYVKDDSCNAPPGVSPFTEYGDQRDALNATGTAIYFNMCWGAGLQIASQGRAYGNAWRIDEDDGGGWAPVLQNVNTDAGLYNYSGCDWLHGDGLGCGWNDPGLLIVGALPDVQGRTHFNLWAILAAKLLISEDPRNFTAYSKETLLNAEVVAVDQDELGVQGRRLVPPFNSSRWAADQRLLADAAAAKATDSPLAPLFRGAAFDLPPSHWHKYGVVNPEYRMAFGDVLQLVEGTELRDALAAGGRVEVWARPLVGGSFAVLFFNNGIDTATAASCDMTNGCWQALGFGSTSVVSVRDLWTHTDNGTVTGGITVPAIATNASVMVKLTPATGTQVHASVFPRVA